MLVSDIKRNSSMGKSFNSNNIDSIIEHYIEKPLQKTCKSFYLKNIETNMSSANKYNVLKSGKKRVHKRNILENNKHHKINTFLMAGKGYAWIMINYNDLSDENKKLVFELKDELGEDIILFVRPIWANFYKKFQKIFRLRDVILETFDGYDEKFKENQVILAYNTNQYPGRSVFIRMPIDNKTTIEDVEKYYDRIINRFNKQ